MQLIGRIYQIVATGQQTVKGALQTVVDGSDTMKTGTNWSSAVDGLRAELMNGRNEILPATWKSNYQQYMEEALRILDGPNPPHDGHGLLQRTLERWKGKAASRAACCIAIRNLTDHAMARHHAAACWTITAPIVKNLRGKTSEKRTKATLSDSEMLYLIEGVDRRNPGWANVLRALALFGLRPIELQHLVPKPDDQGVLRMWCSYRKNCGGQLTAPRWLLPAPLHMASGERQDWNITGAMVAGLLEIPEGRDGGFRVLNGHYVEQFLRIQPEWKELKAIYTARGNGCGLTPSGTVTACGATSEGWKWERSPPPWATAWRSMPAATGGHQRQPLLRRLKRPSLPEGMDKPRGTAMDVDSGSAP
ncbi:site-specific integrase [Cyanobium sp. ATX-6F1]|uniref:site-specific integrase n=1 Tax=Cyanobium sp. ATX-6F1 TaxID=3137388 RepID=UPI0039BE1356